MTMHDLTFKLDPAGAADAIAPLVRRTPVMRDPGLEDPDPVGHESPVFLKLENLQVTGSFKARGAANRVLALSAGERKRGVVACSSGNHGRAVAYMAGRLGIPAVICVPAWVDPLKREGMERSGARVILAGNAYDEAEVRAEEFSREEGLVFVQPFDDPWVAAGQGTLGLELLEQVPHLGTVLIPLSGGGLAGGVAYALKERRPQVRVVAVSAMRARVMYESIKAGSPVSLPEEETRAEALSGGIGLVNRYTFPLIRELVDEHVLVEEEEIRRAMLYAWRSLNLLVEGGGAVALAAVLARKGDPGRDPGAGAVAVVVSGGNVSLERFRTLADAPPT
jgi:threonine dehydratase